MATEPFDAFFAALIAQYEALGLIGLGKLADPTEGAPRIEPARTRAAIEVLQMLERKTRGNLTPDEERELRRVLTTLRLNYVEAAKAEPAPPEGREPKSAPEEEDHGSEPN
jgi:hypothetical protein